MQNFEIINIQKSKNSKFANLQAALYLSLQALQFSQEHIN
jgi:hypothetical protein